MMRLLRLVLLVGVVATGLAACYVVPAPPPTRAGVAPAPPPALSVRPACRWTYGQGWFGWGWYAAGC